MKSHEFNLRSDNRVATGMDGATEGRYDRAMRYNPPPNPADFNQIIQIVSKISQLTSPEGPEKNSAPITASNNLQIYFTELHQYLKLIKNSNVYVPKR